MFRFFRKKRKKREKYNRRKKNGNRWRFNIAKKEAKWRSDYPMLAERIDKLEEKVYKK